MQLPKGKCRVSCVDGICCDAGKKKDTENTKRLREKHIYSSNRNKIQVNLVKQKLVDRKPRVQWGSDCPSTTQVVSHMAVSCGSSQLPLTLR